MSKYELSIVIPCLNEAQTIKLCIKRAQLFLKKNKIIGEVIISNNGSLDNSVKISINQGAKVVHIFKKGYGAALQGGIKNAQGKYIIIGDADNSYDFLDTGLFYKRLKEGYSLVVGNRLNGKISPGAMPWLNRYIGTPALTFLGRLLFKTKVGDINCGLRGFTKKAWQKMDLKTIGMEYASEMIIKATNLNLKICEISINYYKDGRTKPSSLRPFKDGLRHINFMLMFWWFQQNFTSKK